MDFWSLRKDGPLLWCLGILAIAVIVFGASLGNGFVLFDDDSLITRNWAVQQFSIPAILHVFSSYDPELYVPLTFVGYQLIHLFFGLQPWAYHAVSLSLHLINALLVGWIIFSLTGRKFIAVGVTGLFALHPLQAETILWASALKDLLSGFFFLLSVGFYIQWRRHNHRSTYAWSVIWFVLALLSKVSVALLPVVLLLIDHAQGRKLTRGAWMEKWPYGALAAFFILVALGGKTENLSQVGPVALFLLALKSSAFYLWKMIWPFDFSVLYPQLSAATFSDASFVVSALGVAVILVAIVFGWNRWKTPAACLAFYIIMLLPSFSNVVKNGFVFFASDRYAYLASIGIFLLALLGIDLAAARLPSVRWAVIAVGCLALAGFSLQSAQQVLVWHDTGALFGNALRLAPYSALAQNNLAASLADTGAQLVGYRRAIALDPSFLTPYSNIAAIEQKQGNVEALLATYESGMMVFNRMTTVGDVDLSFVFSYGQYLDDQGKTDDMFAVFRDALDKAPDSAEAHFNLGLKEEEHGDAIMALTEYEQASQLGSSDPHLYYQLASLAASQGKLKEAARALQRVLDIDPAYPNAQRHLNDLETLIRQHPQSS